MKINVHTNNQVILEGRLAAIKEYSKDKAANVVITIESGVDQNGQQRKPNFISTKSFTPACYNACKVGMKARIYGHLGPNKYTDEKTGEEVFGIDVIADYIEFIESKAVVDAREAAKAAIVD